MICRWCGAPIKSSEQAGGWLHAEPLAAMRVSHAEAADIHRDPPPARLPLPRQTLLHPAQPERGRKAMLCSICEAEEAAFTIIPTGEGLPQILGPACFARGGLELAKQILPAEEIAATLGPLFVAPARAEALTKGGKSKAKASPAEESEPSPGPETAPAPTEESSATADG